MVVSTSGLIAEIRKAHKQGKYELTVDSSRLQVVVEAPEDVYDLMKARR